MVIVDLMTDQRPIPGVFVMPTTTNVMNYGATGNGVADDTSAIQSAIAATDIGGVIYFPVGRYRITSTITVDNAKSVVGLSYGSETRYGNYSTLVADLAVTPVLLIAGGAGSVGAGCKSLGISRADGTAPANTVGIEISGTNEVIIEDVTVNRQYYGVRLLNAVGTRLVRLNTWACSYAHILIDGVTVEVDFLNTRLGRNGSDDTDVDHYVFLSGYQWDTVRFSNCQFNIGGGKSALNVFYVEGYDNLNGILVVEGGHFEAWTGSFLVIGNTTVNLRRFKIIGATITSALSARPFIAGDSSKLSEMTLTGCNILTNISLDRVSSMSITGNCISGSNEFLVNSCGGTIVSNFFINDVKLQGTMSGLVFSSNRTKSLTDTSSGARVVSGNI